jgi:hypothetical protein
MGVRSGGMVRPADDFSRVPATRSLLSVLVLSAVLVTGCTGDDPAEPAPTTTPLAAVDLTGVAVPRSTLCEAIDEESVAAVLGGEPERADTWSPGDRVELPSGSTDVAHEHGCSWARGPVLARAWVFAQPVTAAPARAWLRELRSGSGCEPTGPLEFGSPGAVVSCAARRSTTVRMAGLFGDAYLTCEVARGTRRAAQRASPEQAGTAEQAQRWCADVALATA